MRTTEPWFIILAQFLPSLQWSKPAPAHTAPEIAIRRETTPSSSIARCWVATSPGSKVSCERSDPPARPPAYLPTVMTVEAVLGRMDGVTQLMSVLRYGASPRLIECARLPVKDVDLDRRQILVRDRKGGRDRVTVPPASALHELRAHLERMRRQHALHLVRGAGWVQVPFALARELPAVGG